MKYKRKGASVCCSPSKHFLKRRKTYFQLSVINQDLNLDQHFLVRLFVVELEKFSLDEKKLFFQSKLWRFMKIHRRVQKWVKRAFNHLFTFNDATLDTWDHQPFLLHITLMSSLTLLSLPAPSMDSWLLFRLRRNKKKPIGENTNVKLLLK